MEVIKFMNFKTKSNNITKVLYTVLVLCIISIMILSIYSMFNKPEVKNNQGNVNGGNSLKNGSAYDDSEDAAFEFFKKSTTEASTQAPTQKPTNAPPKQNEMPNEDEQDNLPDMTDKEADIVILPHEEVIEVVSVPAVYIKPVAGSVSTLHNPDTPAYSVAMNDYRTHMKPEKHMLLIPHVNQPGMIARVAGVLGDDGVNISRMHVAQKSDAAASDLSIMIICTDGTVEQKSLDAISKINGVQKAVYVNLNV